MNRRSPMKRGKRINPKRKTPRRTRSELFFGHKRERLYGAERSARRAEIFERAGGRCEDVTGEMIAEHKGVGLYFRCGAPINLGTYDPATNPRGMEWSHKRHGANKCDCYSPTAQDACSIASCHTCHVKRHNCGGKPIAVRKRDIKMEVA